MKKKISAFILLLSAYFVVGQAFWDGVNPVVINPATNLFAYGLTNRGWLVATNPFLYFGTPGGILGVVMTNDGGQGLQFFGIDSPTPIFKIDDGAVILPIATANTVMALDSQKRMGSIANGPGALTNNGTGGIGYFDISAINGVMILTNGFDGNLVPGNRVGNIVLLANTNITFLSTNTTSGNKTNSIWFDTAQPITTNASPTFANVTASTKIQTAYLTNSGPTDSTGAVTNWGTLRQSGNQTNDNNLEVTKQIAIGNNSNARLSAYKSMFLGLTNAANGYGDWKSVSPMPSRRNWFWTTEQGNNISSIGVVSASSLGTAGHAVAQTNCWPEFTYATGASITSNGISGGAQNQFFPGNNCFFSFRGRVSHITTNRVWIGLTSGTSVSMGNTDTPTTLSVAAIRLSSSAAGALTNFSFVTCDGSACTVNDGPVSLTTTNQHVFEILEDRANSRWLAYIDGTIIATNTANLPISGMQYLILTTSLGSEVAKTIRGSVIYGEIDNRLDTGAISFNP